MRDILPGRCYALRHIEQQLINVFTSYGYGEVRLPLAENSELFHKSIGAGTDIIDKEMYHLRASSERESATPLSLRPEGTAGCVRAAIQHGLLREGARLWYQGEMFRHERPQKGRFRQFRQMGVELIGFGDIEADAELLSMGTSLWRQLATDSHLRLEINSLGCAEARAHYLKDLVAFLLPRATQLDPDSQKRLEHNPLRILDTKNSATQALLRDAPQLADYWHAADTAHFSGLQDALRAMHIDFHVNPRLVRGLDYYSGLVFEWLLVDEQGAQNTLAAGGRYDNLVRVLGGGESQAAGFAIGMERLEDLLIDDSQVQPSAHINASANLAQNTGINTYIIDAYIIVTAREFLTTTLSAVEKLRRAVPEANICGPLPASEKSQLRRAQKHQPALIFSSNSDSKWHVRDLCASNKWQDSSVEELIVLLREQVKKRGTNFC